jgi:hypothetical protein
MTSVQDWLEGPAFPDTEESTMSYQPDHPALQHPGTAKLEPYTTLEQNAVLIRLWGDGWRMLDDFPQLREREILIQVRKPSDIPAINVKMVRRMSCRVTAYGEVLDRREFEEPADD